MTTDEKIKALIDTDFLSHIADIKKVDPIQTFKHYCSAAQLDVCMHERVYEEEAKTFPTTTPFFEHKAIEILRFIDALNEDERTLYKMYVTHLYSSFKKEPYPCGGDVFQGWQRKCSLGEVHSIAVCIMFAYSIFLSDDKDSKKIHTIAKENFKGKNSKVLNRKEAIDAITEFSNLTRSERRAISHS